MAGEFTSQTGFAEINGTKLYYEIAGSGPTLVLLHAGIADSRMWDNQFGVFAQHCRVVRYDLRGYGQSPLVVGTYSHRDDLYQLLQYLKIDRAYLLGCSKGGTTIIDFALEHPEYVAGLISVTASVSGYEFTGSLPKQWSEAVAAFKSGDFERVSELEVQIWVDGPHRAPGQVNAAIRDKVRQMNIIPLKNEAKTLGREQQLDPPAFGRLSEIQAPTMVVIGDLDDPDIVMAGEVMARQIPNAEKWVVSGTAHLPNMEQPEAFNRLILGFLQKQEQK
ncbi:MAG: alpha/beta hydrolase [Anaerolineae bacterium]|nr:alpha/beta hydrolase [Anaerolineae bacterium]